MRKIFIFALILTALLCSLAIGVNAEEMNPEYNDGYVRVMTQGMTSVELEDGSFVDLYDAQGYTLCYYWNDVSAEDRVLMSVRTQDLTFKFNGTRLSSVYYGEEYLAGNAHTGKIVVLNLRGVKNGSGADITDFNGDNLFKENSPLQHIFMPDSIEHLTNYAFGHRDGSLSHLRGCYFSENSKLQEIKGQTFMNARQLRGFYIPKGVTYVGANGFQGCHNAFFVNDPYDFLTKPDVYYFPEGFYKAVEEAFDSLKYNLNKVLVFTADNIEITNPFAFEAVACGDGTKPIIVFKGDVSAISVGYWNVSAIYFANENDIDAVTAGANGNKTMFFCHAEDNLQHLAEKTMETEATCTLPKMVADFCFCGQYIPGTETTEGDPLGHGNMSIVDYMYENYMAKGVCYSTCDRCDDVISGEIDALFMSKGVSAKTFGADIGLVQGYEINRGAIEAYKAYADNFNFGVLAYANMGGTEVAPKPDDEKVINIVFDNMANDYLEVKVVGIPADYLDAPIVFCVYVTDGDGFYYLDNGNTTETIVGTSYNDIAVE